MSGDVGGSEAIAANHPDLKNVFSEANKKRTIDYLERLKSASKNLRLFHSEVPKVYKKAAVLIPLCYNLTTNEPSLLYMLRSLKLKKHRGEVSFPGGAIDETDQDHIQAALRETNEELGLDKHDIEIWNTLDSLPTASSVMRVTPILGMITKPIDPHQLHINPSEVEKTFTIPLQHFCQPENWGHTQYFKRFGAPIYKNLDIFHPEDTNPANPKPNPLGIDEQTKSVQLWGLTAILTHIVMEALLPNLYKRKVQYVRPSENP